MNVVPQKQDDSDKRACDRFSVNRMVKITFPDERTVVGCSVNISLGGMLIKTAQHNDEKLLGQMAQMHLISGEGQASDAYACTVIRVTSDLIGLAIDQKISPKLCKELTRGIFNRSCSARAAGE